MTRFNSQIHIGDRKVGSGQPAFIIAEAGVAHFGSLKKAIQLVHLAKNAGADAVKFQLFDVDRMIASSDPEWRARMSTRQLSNDQFLEVKQIADELGIICFSTAHDEKAFEFLESINTPLHKIGSGEKGNLGYFKRVAATGKPLIFSTGMYSEEEIDETLGLLRDVGNENVIMLHCTTNYPTPPAETFIRNIENFRKKHEMVIGYSDHSVGIHLPLTAVALGAQVIEKHISLDFNIPGAQDWKVSCDQESLTRLVDYTRDIEAALSAKTRIVSEAEVANAHWATKSLTTSRPVKIGEVITNAHLCVKRPGTGIKPSCISEVVGKKATRDLAVDETLKWEDVR